MKSVVTYRAHGNIILKSITVIPGQKEDRDHTSLQILKSATDRLREGAIFSPASTPTPVSPIMQMLSTNEHKLRNGLPIVDEPGSPVGGNNVIVPTGLRK